MRIIFSGLPETQTLRVSSSNEADHKIINLTQNYLPSVCLLFSPVSTRGASTSTRALLDSGLGLSCGATFAEAIASCFASTFCKSSFKARPRQSNDSSLKLEWFKSVREQNVIMWLQHSTHIFQINKMLQPLSSKGNV